MKWTCKKHGEYEGDPVLTLTAILTNGKETMHPPCPECIAEREREDVAKEMFQKEQREADILRMMNIEPMYSGATLDNYNAETDGQKKAVELLRKMVTSKCGKVVLLGGNGTGKTHLASAVVRSMGGRLFSMYEITTRIRATYAPLAKEDELEVVNELARISVLAIDEIGRTKGSEAETNWLSYIIDKRHVRRLPLILISNKHMRKTCKSGGCPDCLENYLGDDILSRLREDGDVINCDWGDYRKIKRQGRTE